MAVLLALVTNRILALFDMPIWLAGASWKIIEDKNELNSLTSLFIYKYHGEMDHLVTYILAIS